MIKAWDAIARKNARGFFSDARAPTPSEFLNLRAFTGKKSLTRVNLNPSRQPVGVLYLGIIDSLQTTLLSVFANGTDRSGGREFYRRPLFPLAV